MQINEIERQLAKAEQEVNVAKAQRAPKTYPVAQSDMRATYQICHYLVCDQALRDGAHPVFEAHHLEGARRSLAWYDKCVAAGEGDFFVVRRFNTQGLADPATILTFAKARAALAEVGNEPQRNLNPRAS